MSAENAPATQAPVDVTKGLTEAMEKVSKLVENIAKAATAANGATEETAELAADAAVEKSHKGKGEVRKAFRTTLKSSGLTGEAYTNALKAFDATFTTATTETTAETTKAAETPSAESVASDALAQLTETISKAKVFTPARQKQLMEMSVALKAIIDDLIQIPQGTMPSTNTPALQTSPGSTVNIAKSVEDMVALVTKSIADQTAILEDTQKRLEAVEKARLPGNGLSNDETAKVEKKKASIWGNVI